MADKVALPSLSLPKQKTHWTVGVVIAAGVLFVILGAAFYQVLRSRQAEADSIAKRESDRLESIKAEKDKAEMEKGRAEAEKAASEAKKKEAEASALAAKSTAAAAVATAAADADKNKKKGPGHKAGGTKVANGKTGPTPAPGTASPGPSAAPPPPTPKQQSKASKDIDDLLKSFK
jgi:hypothetical protein